MHSNHSRLGVVYQDIFTSDQLSESNFYSSIFYDIYRVD